MVVLVLAASSGPFDVWRTPYSDGGTPTVVTDPPATVEPQETAPEASREWPSWVSTLLRLIGIAVAVLAITAALAAIASFVRKPSFRGWSLFRDRSADGAALPEVDDERLVVDVNSARNALAAGTPRNAIVACWMQLERDAAAAGLPRLPFETPTEYVERVIGASSVDPAPIGDLASLYREARFSRHELVDAHRSQAMAALDRVARALHQDAENPA
jgi:hypothetical protein